MNVTELTAFFNEVIKKDSNISPAVAAIKTLLEYIRLQSFSTVVELRESVINAIDVLTRTDSSAISVRSGCEMLLRFITLTALDAGLDSGMEKCKEILLKNGQVFLSKASKARSRIARVACPWIPSGSNILVHSKSRVVLEILKEACVKNGTFHVYVCESSPDNSGLSMMEELNKLGIKVTLILDAAVGAVMEKVDFVLLGAEAVVESGGIINKIGTSTIGLCAKMLNKPVYVAVESFKFVRFYPLNNRDIPNEFKYKYSTISSVKDLENEHPLIDYTQPSLLTLLFTDIGIFTPSAVSDELVKLYL
ncbi:translation initiation factor eIF-2B subunit alpha [Brachionus plicatilis]|uniref:Translation initiation factor eIF2B subunit alpha n=1 Tax=Brachionus plicatilis TaxID=10195 RepID=A0A3M7SX77_BRAPC|nr:translation initiation factor eIF-2B subunit alpha [Brachionus plicatilis]